MRSPEFRQQRAASVVRAGGVIAYPTEAVWGLGCDPTDETAVKRILEMKSRTSDKGLILVGASIEQFSFLLQDLDKKLVSRLRSSWPGPVTWLVPHRGRVPSWISGRFDTVALRVTAFPRLQSLCEACGGPLVSTSANVSGHREARELYQLMANFGDFVDYIAPGRVQGLDRPSEIRDLRTDTIMRGS